MFQHREFKVSLEAHYERHRSSDKTKGSGLLRWKIEAALDTNRYEDLDLEREFFRVCQATKLRRKMFEAVEKPYPLPVSHVPTSDAEFDGFLKRVSRNAEDSLKYEYYLHFSPAKGFEYRIGLREVKPLQELLASRVTIKAVWSYLEIACKGEAGGVTKSGIAFVKVIQSPLLTKFHGKKKK